MSVEIIIVYILVLRTKTDRSSNSIHLGSNIRDQVFQQYQNLVYTFLYFHFFCLKFNYNHKNTMILLFFFSISTQYLKINYLIKSIILQIKSIIPKNIFTT